MGKDAVLHIRIDADEKQKAETLYEGMGTSLSEAVRIFIKQSNIVHGFPFSPISTEGKGTLKAQGALKVYAHQQMREDERVAWIRSLSDKYESLNR